MADTKSSIESEKPSGIQAFPGPDPGRDRDMQKNSWRHVTLNSSPHPNAVEILRASGKAFSSGPQSVSVF